MSAKSLLGVVESVLLAACVGAAACDGEQNACDRAGCNAVGQPAIGYAITTGIAGAAASQSDVVMNDCAACPLASATLRLHDSTTPILTQAEAQALVDEQGTVQSVSVEETYERELAPGEYLACDSAEGAAVCAGLTVAEGEVTTLHVRFANGPTELIVYLPGATEPATDRIFEVSLP